MVRVMHNEDNQQYNDDQWLQQAVKQEYNQVPSPAPMKESMWKQIQMERKEQPKKKSSIVFNKSYLSVAAAFLILLIGSLFIQLKDGEAFGWFSNYFIDEQGDRTEINNQISDNPIDQPPALPSYDAPLRSKELIPIETEMSLEEAVEKASFHIVIPSKLPDGYQLGTVTLRQYKGEPLEGVDLQYVGNTQSFIIAQKKIIGEYYSSNMTVNNNLAEVETINLNGTEATYIGYDDGTTELIWLRMRTKITITGELSKEEVLEIAKSLH